jgi:hypothetical protein
LDMAVRQKLDLSTLTAPIRVEKPPKSDFAAEMTGFRATLLFARATGPFMRPETCPHREKSCRKVARLQRPVGPIAGDHKGSGDADFVSVDAFGAHRLKSVRDAAVARG